MYLTRFEESARRAALEADRELSAGVDRGPLHGIPIGIKDVFATVEGPTTWSRQPRYTTIGTQLRW